MPSQPPPIHEETFTIRQIECDFNNQWKPVAMFQHLTEAAGTHATLLGVGFDAMYARDLFWIHSRIKIQFFRLPHAGDLITIRTWPKTIRRRLLYIRDFIVQDPSGVRLLAASSAWVIVNTDTHRLVSPKSVNFDIPAVTDPVGLDDPLDSLYIAPGGEERLRLLAGYSSLDLVGHVTSSRYVEWICDAFPVEMFRQRQLDWLQINYEHEILPGEEVAILVKPDGDDSCLWAIEGHNVTNDTRAFQSLVRWKE